MKDEVVYLIFFIYHAGLKEDPKKVKVIIEWPVTKSTVWVISFHGLEIFL